MKAAAILAASGAALSMAAALDKRAMETVWDVAWVTVTVTAGQEAAMQTPGKFFEESPEEDAEVIEAPVFSTIQPAPEPEPTTEVVVEPTTQPQTTTTPTPSPAPSPQPEPEPEPEQPEQDDTPSPPSGNDMQESALYSHNVHRRNHSAPALEWEQKYADYALQSARTCVFEHDLSPGGGGYGQNLAMWGATDGDDLGEATAIAQATTNMWYNGELNAYLPSFYGQEPDMSDFSVWGHFSQLVWVDTEKLGCAVHFCEAGTMNPTMGVWYSVCNYYPAGNMGGSFSRNVLPPGDADTIVA